MGPTNDLIISAESGAFDNDPDVTVIKSTQVLEPGHYWICNEAVDRCAEVGETLLLLDVIEFEEKLHSVQLMMHPKYGGSRTFTMLVGPFLSTFVPCQNAEEIRNREQQDVMAEIAGLQDELMKTQVNPRLMNEAISPIVEAKMSELRREESDSSQHVAKKQDTSTRALAKTHRRAARRSEAAGNPLVVPRLAVSNSVAGLIGSKINESGVAHLRDLAIQQTVVAKAQAEWLTGKTREISKILESLTPYIEERAAVAIARSSGAIKLAQQIESGIRSLNLYTGAGVQVYDIRSGRAAPTNEPLVMLQAKRFMQEELAAWADVDSLFDYDDRQAFFDELGRNDDLLNQVLPSPRCVATMAVRRADRSYDNAYDNLMKNLENHCMFLLVRNGENVHIVYSADPSHEAAHRLFPTRNEMGEHFQGADGQDITIRDIEFGEATASFENSALLYKRLLILLCGLDHRLKLFGDFYPPEKQMQFMHLKFQEQYFRFVADDERDTLLGDSLKPVVQWMSEQNALLQSGSRVFVMKGSGVTANSPELKRRHSLMACHDQFRRPMVATREGKQHIVTLGTESKYSWGKDEGTPNVKCILRDEALTLDTETAWWLCVDGTKLDTVRRYRHSRITRAMGVGYLRLIRRLEAYLVSEADAERDARAYLFENATTHGGMTEAQAQESLDTAVRNWRAARRGEALPTVNDVARLNEVLSLMIPASEITAAMESMLSTYLATLAAVPLALTRSGKNKYCLYLQATRDDKAMYPDLLTWRWVRRVVLTAGKTKLTEASSSLVWLLSALPAAEIEVRRWAGFEEWFNTTPESLALRKYRLVLPLLKATEQWADTLKGGPGTGIPDEIFHALRARYAKAVQDNDHECYVSLPMAAYSVSGKALNMALMRGRLGSVLKSYCSPTQLDHLKLMGSSSRKWVRYWDALEPIFWKLVSCTPSLNSSPDKVFDQIDGSWTTHPSWSCGKMVGNRNQNRDKQGAWSLNRSFDELADGTPRLKKRYFIEKKERAKWPSFERVLTEAQEKEPIARYEHPYRVVFSGLARSSEKGRSLANAFFIAPLLTHSPYATRPHQFDKYTR